MNLERICLIASLTATVAGCAAVYRAEEVQKALAPKAVGTAEDAVWCDLADYSVREYVDFAMTNRPEVVSASIAVERERAAMKELEADAPLVSTTPWKAPKVAASIGRSESSDRSHHIRGDTHGGASGSLSLNLLVYDFGRHDAKVAKQAESVIAAELQLVKEGYRVFDEVASAYFQLREKDALLAAAKTNEFEYSVHLRRIEDELEVGEAKALDLVRARLDLATACERTVTASNDVIAAVAGFKRALGIEASRSAREEVFAADENPLVWLYRAFPVTACRADAAMDAARTNAPALAVARSRLRAAASQVDYAKADLLPSVNATVSLNWTDPLWYWQWGYSATETIFQGGRKVAALDRAVLEMESAAAAVDTAEHELALEIELAVAERNDAAKARETAAASLKQAKDNLELVRSRYELGDASRVDYTSAVAAYAAALGGRVSAFYRAQRAEVKLFALVGRFPVYREDKVKELK